MTRRITACDLFLSDVLNAEVKTRVVIQRIPRFDITVVINACIILNQLRLMRINDLLLLRSNDPIVKKRSSGNIEVEHL